jgi:hypothetical protein
LGTGFASFSFLASHSLGTGFASFSFLASHSWTSLLAFEHLK